MQPYLEKLHARFCELTGACQKTLKFRLFERTFYEFHAGGFTLEDMELVIAHIKRLNRNYSIPRKLTIRSVIEDLPRFAEDLVEARRLEARKTTSRERAIGELRGFIPERGANDAIALGELLKKAKQ